MGRHSARGFDRDTTLNGFTIFSPRASSKARWVFLSLFLTGGCDHLSPALRETPPPEIGPRMAQSVLLTFDPPIRNSKAPYRDRCNVPRDLSIGASLEPLLVEAASRNFQAVSVRGGTVASPTHDADIVLSIPRSNLKVEPTDATGLSPVVLTIEGSLTVKDFAGKELGRRALSFHHKASLRPESSTEPCDYRNIDDIMREAGAAIADDAIRAARALIAGTVDSAPMRKSSASVVTTPRPAVPTESAGSGLTFNAALRDENSNLVFEAGEHIRVRIDLHNGSDREVRRISVSLTGTASLVSQFAPSAQTIDRLQPGQSRSIEFLALIPKPVHAQKAELVIRVSGPDIDPPAPQTLSLSIQPTAVRVEDVDQVPAAAEDFRRPHTYLLAIGIGSYRDQQSSMRKYGASDAEMVATYFRSLGGIPASNVRLLQDWKAGRADIDEALLDWLPAHANRDAVVLVYFAGAATVSATGDVFLTPYDGETTSISRAYPLRDLEAGLTRLRAKHIVVFFDASLAATEPVSPGKPLVPKWAPLGNGILHVTSTGGLESSPEDDKHRHGLFTYFLLRGMRGEADTNRDGEVTLAETGSYLSQKVLWASRNRYGTEQRPLISPPLKPGDPTGSLVLSKPASVRATESP
jgi:hypothetical protein